MISYLKRKKQIRLNPKDGKSNSQFQIRPKTQVYLHKRLGLRVQKIKELFMRGIYEKYKKTR